MIRTPMATQAEHGTRCAVCRRSLLVGESARTYQDPRSRGIQTVCILCTGRADKIGWQLVGEGESRRPIPVRSDNEVDHERLVGRLQTDLQKLEREVGGTQEALAGERSSREELERRLVDLQDQLAAARAETAALQVVIDESDRVVADAERRARESLEAQEMLLRARRREADPAYVCGIAVEVFNRSAHLGAVLAAATDAGTTPRVRVGVEGIMLPRTIRLIFAWPDSARSFRVTCDLVARIFEVEDVAHGAGPAVPAFEPNATLEDDRLVLAAG
jgi:hypothetical protein